MVSLLYQGLVRVGPDMSPIGDLAEKWNVIDDKFTFYISNKSRFSDGSLLTCSDILRSIKAFQSDKTPFKAAFKKINTVKCLTNKEFYILTFLYPSMAEKFLLADLPVLKIFKNSLGSGPFVLTEENPSFSLIKPNKYYPNPQNYSLKFFYLKDDFARFLKVYKGEIDISPNSLPFEKLNSFKNSSFQVYETPSLSTSYLLINFKNLFLNDLDLRKKIYRSLDLTSLAQNRFENHVTIAKSLLFPSHPYYSPSLKNIHFDSLKKTKLLRSPLVFKTSNSRQSIENGKIIAQSLRANGIPVVLQSYEWGTYYKDVKQGNYDLALMKWVGVVDPDIYNIAFHSKEFPPGRNRGYYKSTSLDKMLDDASKIKNSAKRKIKYREIQDFVFKNLAIIPLWHENQIHILHPRIQGYKANPMGDFYPLLNLSIKPTPLKGLENGK